MKKLIVGCGYVGRRVASAWQAAGHEVSVLTRSEETARQFEASGLHAVVGDVLDANSLRALPAAETVLYAVGLDRGSGKSQREVYVDGLEKVLRQVAGNVGRFLYISSTSVYGQAAGEEIDETSPCQPTRENGLVCLTAEQLIWKYFPAKNTASSPGANILRLSGIYGPGRLIARVEALRTGALLSGNPDAWLNLIHVDDAVAAVLACESRGRPHELYLVSDDQPVRRREYFSLLAQIIGAPVPEFSPLDSNSPEAQQFNKRCVNHKLRKELQVTLAYPTIATGLPSAVN